MSMANAEYLVRAATSDLGVPLPEEICEQIVRCCDCRRAVERRGKLWCRDIVSIPVAPDGFCAWGMRAMRDGGAERASAL